jgi:hypothetical protein
MPLRKGKKSMFVILKEETINTLADIAKKEVTSRSAIAAKIIEENLSKYIKEETP